MESLAVTCFCVSFVTGFLISFNYALKRQKIWDNIGSYSILELAAMKEADVLL